MKTYLGQKSGSYPKDISLFSVENIVGSFVFLTFLAIYTKTLCPTVFWWDSGEFIANIAVLGIPHRPGFPIYVLLGKFFSLLPLGGVAFRVNLLSAILTSASLTILYKFFLEAARLFFPEMAKRKGRLLFSALFFVLISGFTYTFWIQAVRAEVYSLNIFFFSLPCDCVFRFGIHRDRDIREKRPGRCCPNKKKSVRKFFTFHFQFEKYRRVLRFLVARVHRHFKIRERRRAARAIKGYS